MADKPLHVELAFAEPHRRFLIELEIPPGSTAGDAIRLSGILGACPGTDTAHIGIFGEHVEHTRVLEDGDRVEIYRPLSADPKQVRRERASAGQTVGRGR